jgi:hypothetical protein
MTAFILTQEELKSKLHYDIDTGIFTRLTKRRGASEGSLSGCLGNDGYVRISIEHKKYLAHRLAWLYMTGEMPKNQIDHINLVKNDNRFENLREATISQNGQNTYKRSNNTSGYKGINWSKSGKCWRYQAMINNVKYSKDGFKTAIEAYGEYINFVSEKNKSYANVK